MQHINMDKVVKENYKMFVFDRLPLIEPVYQRQVSMIYLNYGAKWMI